MLSEPIVLRLPPEIKMTDDQFFEFCQINRDLRIERNKLGELLIMTPTASDTGYREAGIIGQLWVWSKKDGTGISFSSSTGFTLSTGLDNPATVSGEPVLPGFMLDMSEIW
jgi:Uma2 family endonuclease